MKKRYTTFKRYFIFQDRQNDFYSKHQNTLFSSINIFINSTTANDIFFKKCLQKIFGTTDNRQCMIRYKRQRKDQYFFHNVLSMLYLKIDIMNRFTQTHNTHHLRPHTMVIHCTNNPIQTTQRTPNVF